MKSDSIANLAAALAKAQPKIEGAIKDKTNPHFRSQYADLGNVVDAVKPALAENGLSFIQVCHDSDTGAKVETVILHESGEWISCGIIHIPASKQDAQGFGSALTYARRYSLSAAFGVAPEDDDGNGAKKSGNQKEVETKKGNFVSDTEYADWQLKFMECTDTETLKTEWDKCSQRCKDVGDRSSAERLKKVMLTYYAKLEVQP